MSNSIYVLGATRIQRKGQCCQMSAYNSLNFSNSVIWPFGEWGLNPSWPPPILRTVQTNNIQGFEGLSGDLEKLGN